MTNEGVYTSLGANDDMTGAMGMDDIWIPLSAMFFSSSYLFAFERGRIKSILNACQAMCISNVICNDVFHVKIRDASRLAS